MKAIPELRGQLAAVQAVALLREDSAWLGNVTAEEQRKRDELDPDEEAVWWQSPEGQEAIARKSKRTFERVMGARYRNTKTAGWES